jgi:hypothetical protein
VPGVFSRDENYHHQKSNFIENTIWQCFEGFLTRFHELCMHKALEMHLEPPFSWSKNYFGGRESGGANECPAAMPSVGTSLGILATEICHLQNFRPLEGIQPIAQL